MVGGILVLRFFCFQAESMVRYGDRSMQTVGQALHAKSKKAENNNIIQEDKYFEIHCSFAQNKCWKRKSY